MPGEMKYQAIVVAGGKGLRMGGSIPKQFVPVGGRPVLMRTLERLYASLRKLQHFSEKDAAPSAKSAASFPDGGSAVLVLVLPAGQQDYWRSLCAQYDFRIPYRLATGGATRFHSVKNGLAAADAEGLIGVHDGVRPFVSPAVVEAAYRAAEKYGAAVPALPVADSLRLLQPDGSSRPVDRSLMRRVQTPQVFRADWLRAAYGQAYREEFTDDASVVEAAGHSVALVGGNPENIKLTTPWDLQVAEMLCRADV